MKRGLILMLLLALPLPSKAAEEGKPNTLTPREIADGWILLWDGETTFGWNPAGGSQWTIFQGMLAPQAARPGVLVTTTEFADYELTCDFRTQERNSPRLLARCDAQGTSLHAKHDIMMMPIGSDWNRFTVQVIHGQPLRPSSRSIGRPLFGPSGAFAETINPDGGPRRGHIALAGNGVIYRSIKLRPLTTRPLFNGTDLTGWKKFESDPKRAKSQFSVTKQGWLNIKDGPGDLQTEGEWNDFILQLECLSNGKHLNSGIFFRCRSGEYQQGYEAQIRNQFTPEPSQDYVIEEYDPKTNELKEKKKSKGTAVDYGTGAIYRRMPARREVAKDGEWFTLTVAAHGRHLATWVNGVQVADWTDHRPLKDNARNGCCLAKGPISLQGHDPTTDLSFRSFRIAELPPSKEKK